MNLTTDLNPHFNTETRRIAVVELVDQHDQSECIAMADDTSALIGRGMTAEEAIADLEQQLYQAEDDAVLTAESIYQLAS